VNYKVVRQLGLCTWLKPGFHSNRQTQSLALRKRKPQETQALALASSQSWLSLLRPSIPIGWRYIVCKFHATNASVNKRKRQPIGMLGRSNGNHDWLLANASASVSCGFRLRNATQAIAFEWKPGLTRRVLARETAASHVHFSIKIE